MPSSLSNATHIFGWFSFSIAMWATISLFLLIEKRSRKEYGGYKNFLRVYCLYAFCFAIIDWLVQPSIIPDLDGFGYAFYSENRIFDLGYDVTYCLQILYCGCFIASSSFLSLNFIYRYVSCCHQKYLKYFQGFGIIPVVLYCMIPFVIWSACVHILFGPTPEKTEQLSKATMKMENFNLTGKPYVGPMCRHFTNSSDHSFGDVAWPTTGSMLGLCTFQIFFYGISLFSGLRTYKHYMKLFKMAKLSKNLYRMQMQLLRATVIQAVVPLISVYVPPAIVIGGAMFGVHVGSVGYFAAMSISMYPPLDSLVFLLTIRDYRNALFCNSIGRIHTVSSSGNPTASRATEGRVY